MAPKVSAVHYLHYLILAAHGDYPGALEALHRYFDYGAVSRLDPRNTYGASLPPTHLILTPLPSSQLSPHMTVCCNQL